MPNMKEIELFDYLKGSIYPDLVKSEGAYDGFDCISDKVGHFIELKCRRTHYDTLVIEKMKYDKLLNESRMRDLIPFYICSTPEGIYSFDLANLDEPQWHTHRMPATSEFPNRAMIDKVVGYFSIEDAERL